MRLLVIVLHQQELSAQGADPQAAVPNARPVKRPPIPVGQDDVALVDARDVCAIGRFSVSYLHAEVRLGRAPQPLRFGPRCSRWRLSDIKTWLAARIEQAAQDAQVATFVKDRAAKASAQAKQKRTDRRTSSGR